MDVLRPLVHVLIPARAFENGMYVFYCNRAGKEGEMEFRGKSVVGTPEGKVEGELGHEHGSFSVVTVSLPALEKARHEHPFLTDLRANIF
jgi:predicted amidohydrolase